MSQTIISLQKAKIFQGKNLILSDVDVNIQQGEFVYLVGKTGSGKSSLLQVLYGDLKLDSGEGQIVDFNLRKLKSKEIPFLRRRIGFVFQDFQLLNDRSVFENLKFVLRATGWKDKNEIKDKINAVLKKVGMDTKGYKMPFHLSGGEQQRVAIARALLNDPDLIIADEPTGNLDPSTTIEVMDLLSEIHLSGKSILMATHDYGLILKNAQRTLKCEDGKLFEVMNHKAKI